MLLSLGMTAWGKRKQNRAEAEEEAAMLRLQQEDAAGRAGSHATKT